MRACWGWLGAVWLINGAALACEPLAQVVKLDGQVSIKPAGKVIKKSVTRTPSPVCEGDEIHTFAGMALIDRKGDKIAVDADSVVRVKRATEVSVDKGKVLFEVQKRGGGEKLEVATRLSVIGVKGTRFLVEETDARSGVALDEGQVEVVAKDGEFALYRQVPVDPAGGFEEYLRQQKKAGEDYSRKMQDEFQKYQAQLKEEFIAFVKSVTLEAGTQLVIVEGKAVEGRIDAESQAALESLKGFLVPAKP